MQEPQANTNIYDLKLWKRFWEIAKPYWRSEQRWKAIGMFLSILLLMILFNKAFAFFFNLVGQSMTALQTKNHDEFNRVMLQMPTLIIAFSLMVVFQNYLMNRLSIEWQLWLTNRFLGKYFLDRAYYQISSDREIDNPDQRICDSIGSFTGISIGFITIFFGAVTSFATFAGVLWNISGRLCLVVLLYALIGTAISTLFGKRLINLNFQVLKKGADFRYGLLQVRENVESIAFYRGEQRENSRVSGKLLELIAVLRMLIGWEKNMGLFTNGYNSLVFFPPYLVLAPLFISGTVKYGVITEAAMAFGAVYASLSVIVKYMAIFGTIATETTRLEIFDRALDRYAGGNRTATSTTITSREDSRLALDKVTLRTPDNQRTLLMNATAEIPSGRGLLIAGPSGTGKSSLLRAIAGLWNAGEGEITRPPLEEILFLPQRPYLILGTLREQILYPDLDAKADDEELEQLLKLVNLDLLAKRCNGFDVVMDWGHLLSPGEQQRLVFARLLFAKPRYAVLDEATSALDVNNEARLYRQLQASGTTYISVGHRPSLLDYHDNVLELTGNGAWRLVTANEFRLASAA